MSQKSLFDKVWEAHLVSPEAEDRPAVLYIDLHLVHEVTSPQAFSVLRERGIKARRPDKTFATMDHSTPTKRNAEGELDYITPQAKRQIEILRQNCAENDVTLLDLDSPHRGIVHIVGPELGLTQPGSTIVCGDSHTATHGAFGALAFGIGTTEVGHVLATQCLLQRKPKPMRITVNGQLAAGVSAKDLILAIIAEIGVNGGTGYVLEYAGDAITGLDMEGRMTLCNMSIEGGARAGMIAPDDTTFDYIQGREYAPKGADWDAAVAAWRELASDDGASFDREVTLDGAALAPMVTFGTAPDKAIPVNAPVPSPTTDAERRGLDYMQFEAGKPILGADVDTVFIGSCTNGRLSDLRAAADVIRGRKVKEGVRMLVVPGSEEVRRDAEAENLHEVFLAAGAQWRIPGCSMCIAMNGDFTAPGKLAVSTSNRNFEGRQGKGARTVLASPITAAAAAIEGAVADPRPYLNA